MKPVLFLDATFFLKQDKMQKQEHVGHRLVADVSKTSNCSKEANLETLFKHSFSAINASHKRKFVLTGTKVWL